MTNLARVKANNTTSVHTLQKIKGFYHVHCNIFQIKRVTGVDVKPEYMSLFIHENGTAYLSKPYLTVEEGKEAAIKFYSLVSGIAVFWDPDAL